MALQANLARGPASPRGALTLREAQMTVRPLIAGNWKMNGLAAQVTEAEAVAVGLAESPSPARVAICPPATLIDRMTRELADSGVEVGGQDCRAEACGAFTGDVCAEMLADAGATLVILGHSERRAGYGESDALIASKVEAALRAGLEPIVCVGETLDQRKAGDAVAVVSGQVIGALPDSLQGKPFAVAYEPVWAIGTGKTPTEGDIRAMHAHIRSCLIARLGEEARGMRILYGGSVKADNAGDILNLAEVNGALVGGASLKCEEFHRIIASVKRT